MFTVIIVYIEKSPYTIGLVEVTRAVSYTLQ